jgi:hypothetical protein
MKILSKYKDYYDYLTGIWGEDPKLILDRRNGNPKPLGEIYDFEKDKSYKITLIICGRLIEGYRFQNKIYYGQDLIQFKNTENSKWDQIDYPHITIENGNKWFNKRDTLYALKPVEGFLDINKKQNCPILIKHSNNTYTEFPKLEELNLGSFINPEEIYIWVQEYLSKQLDESLDKIPLLTNIQKLENKGFDKKYSFRPNIKE